VLEDGEGEDVVAVVELRVERAAQGRRAPRRRGGKGVGDRAEEVDGKKAWSMP
jgi:hypothetical protein